MDRARIKARARNQLGNQIFGNNWVTAVIIIVVAGAIVAIASMLSLGLAALVISGPLTYGTCYLFLKQARNSEVMSLSDLFIGFKEDFSGTFLLGLMQGIFIFLWSLLFIIPGIIKTYAYSMAYYVMMDHPDYDWRRSLQESEQLMKGHKWELFILDLSFIGWLIVGSFCLGIGTLWVTAYMSAARAQFYQELIGYDPVYNQQPEDNTSYGTAFEP